VNVLLLDEPTNHLDMQSCDALLAALDNFEGAVIMVTHNEMFLHALAERLIVFQRDGVSVFEGGYQDFLDRCGWEGEDAPLIIPDKSSKDEIKLNKKDLRRARSEIMQERSRILKPFEVRMAEVEARITALEQEHADIMAGIEQAIRTQDGRAIAQLSKDLSQREQAIERLFDELDHLHSTIELQRRSFDEKLRDIETVS